MATVEAVDRAYTSWDGDGADQVDGIGQDSASVEGRWVHSATGGEYLALQKCQMKVAGEWVEGVIYVAEGLWLGDGKKPVYCRGLGDFMANFARV